jgi:hypothetical protein
MDMWRSRTISSLEEESLISFFFKFLALLALSLSLSLSLLRLSSEGLLGFAPVPAGEGREDQDEPLSMK